MIGTVEAVLRKLVSRQIFRKVVSYLIIREQVSRQILIGAVGLQTQIPIGIVVLAVALINSN
jgi:hypothetical protein